MKKKRSLSPLSDASHAMKLFIDEPKAKNTRAFMNNERQLCV